MLYQYTTDGGKRQPTWLKQKEIALVSVTKVQAFTYRDSYFFPSLGSVHLHTDCPQTITTRTYYTSRSSFLPGSVREKVPLSQG
jgi:hypothetical protein